MINKKAIQYTESYICDNCSLKENCLVKSNNSIQSKVNLSCLALLISLIVSQSNGMEVSSSAILSGSPRTIGSGYSRNAKRNNSFLDEDFFVMVEKHVREYQHFFSDKLIGFVSSFLDDLTPLVTQQLLLRSDNQYLFKSVLNLKDDYLGIFNLGNSDLDIKTIIDSGMEIQKEYNADNCSATNYKATRYSEQYCAIEIMQREFCELYSAKEKRLKVIDQKQLSALILENEIRLLTMLKEFFKKHTPIMMAIKAERAGFFENLCTYYGVSPLDRSFYSVFEKSNGLIEQYSIKYEKIRHQELKIQKNFKKSSYSNVGGGNYTSNLLSIDRSSSSSSLSEDEEKKEDMHNRTFKKSKSNITLSLGFLTDPSHRKSKGRLPSHSSYQSRGNISPTGGNTSNSVENSNNLPTSLTH